MGAIMKTPEDLIGYFDLAIRKRVKQELKKEQAGLGVFRRLTCGKSLFDMIMS